MNVTLCGYQMELNLQLRQFDEPSTELSLKCKDHKPVEVTKFLETSSDSLSKLSLEHVNITPHVEKHAKGPARRPSQYFQQHQHDAQHDEDHGERDKRELELYKRVFLSLGNLTDLTILDGYGVLTEPKHFIKTLKTIAPSLESLKLGKTAKFSSDDNLLIITNDDMASLAELKNLKILHLLGFGGRKQQYFTKLDEAVEVLAKNGMLEEFVFSHSGMTYHSIFCLITHCRNLRILTATSRFPKPGLFMLHNNISFLKVSEHHKESAIYTPYGDSTRALTLHLTNVEHEQHRYDPDWVDETFPEEKIHDE